MMLIAFFHGECSVHHEVVRGGSAVNAAYYIEMLPSLWNEVMKKRPGNCVMGGPSTRAMQPCVRAAGTIFAGPYTM